MSKSQNDSIFEAIKRDDVQSVRKYISTEPEFFEAAPTTWGENPLLVACKHGSRRVAEEIAKQYPQFIRLKNGEGSTALHLACKKGDLPIVKLLLEHDSDLCLEKDKFSKTPLQIAILNGYVEVIRALITACPQAARTVTSQRDTVLLMAAKNYQPYAFEVLLEEIKKLNQEHLLHRKDRQGNNVLHVAVTNKLVEIVKLLLPAGSRALVRINSVNKKGLTVLDLYYERCCWDISTSAIRGILSEAGALQARSLPLRAHVKGTLETKNVILVVLGLVTGAAFTTVCNLPSSFLKDNHKAPVAFHTRDIISGQLPSIFYLMVFNTAILTVCMGAIVVLLWSLPFRPVVLFVTMTIGIVYAMLVSNIMPKFLFRIGTHSILSNCLVGLLAVAFICCGAITYYAFSCLCRFSNWVINITRRGNLLSWFAI